MNLKDKARSLFFDEHENIITIAFELGVSRQTVSKWLKGFAEYDSEVEMRKSENAKNRKYKNMIFMRDSRAEAACIRREHEMAVAELSAEKYH